MADNLFEGLPPPSSLRQEGPSSSTPEPDASKKGNSSPSPALVLKSALKRSKPAESTPNAAAVPVLKSALKRSIPAESAPQQDAPAPGKRLRFKTTTDASEQQVIEAMQKITSHIKNPSKFSKASKLAIQLIKAGSVKPETNNHFFAILEAAMSLPTPCTDPSARADYHALFSAAQDVAEFLDKSQKNLLVTWTIKAVVANDLLTDDSFVFSKTATQIKETISDLPVSTEEDDAEEADAQKADAVNDSIGDETIHDVTEVTSNDVKEDKESDPFGLDALIPNAGKKESKTKRRKDLPTKPVDKDAAENRRFLRSKREALITCLEIAAHRYKIPWCQTVIDILVKHAFDNVSRFTSQQREAVEKLWASVREQQIRRKQGKSVSGKLDVTAFESLQNKYANEKMSIRRSVGASGERHAEQWLG